MDDSALLLSPILLAYVTFDIKIWKHNMGMLNV